jgi:hypothetical protein
MKNAVASNAESLFTGKSLWTTLQVLPWVKGLGDGSKAAS